MHNSWIAKISLLEISVGPFSRDETRKHLMQSRPQKPKKKDKTASPAAAKETSLDAAVEDVLSELDGIFHIFTFQRRTKKV